MTITSKYSGKCWKCEQTIPAGTEVKWDKRNSAISHIGACPAWFDVRI